MNFKFWKNRKVLRFSRAVGVVSYVIFTSISLSGYKHYKLLNQQEITYVTPIPDIYFIYAIIGFISFIIFITSDNTLRKGGE